jgi:alkylation response protein AidB-like acyl-CoA dehydrogenase
VTAKSHEATGGSSNGTQPPAARRATFSSAGREAVLRDLSPEGARARLPALGRLLYDADVRTLWARDTETLPRIYRRLRRHYRAFAETHLVPRALEADADPGAVDRDALFRQAARAGLQTEFLPAPFGTGSLRALAGGILMPAVLKAEELAAGCGGLGLVLLGHDLGVAPLFLSGDLRALNWQRRIYRRIARGEADIVAYAITEPGAGSDVEETEGAATARIVTRARPVHGGFRLRGRKCFITNGAAARWVSLFAAEERSGVERWTCFLLDRGMPGLSVGRKERKMGQRAADASELVLEDVFVPDDRVIGRVGGGWALNRNVLNYSRPAVGAIALGIGRSAFESAARFCNETRLNGRLLVSYQAVQLRLASMLTRLQAARALVWQAARYPRPFQAAGAMPKVFCSEVAYEVATDAMALLGDHGYLHVQRVEKAARDARLCLIYEGTNQVNRLAIVESQLGAEFEGA